MISVFSPKNSPRLEYVLQHLCEVLWGNSFRIFQDEADFRTTPAECRINYSDRRIADAFHIPVHGLLFESDIHPQHIDMKWENDFPYCFALAEVHENGIGWDVFSACFYFLSRYEEYLPFAPDVHGRFPAEESLAFHQHCLQLPLVDLWAEKLSDKLQLKFPAFSVPKRKACFKPTYDIDIAYAFREKNWSLNLLGSVRQKIRHDQDGLILRKKVRAGLVPDPYDTFEALQKLHAQEDIRPLYFVLFARRSRFDKGISPRNQHFRQQIRKLSEEGEVGIHASYASAFSKSKRIQHEIHSLFHCTGKNIGSNRCHYLRLHFPDTFRNLITSGIHDDYSMGYSTQAGFRAGSCTPFRFFDLKKNCSTSLILHPLLLMENSFFAEKNRSEEALWEKIRPLLDQVLHYGGEAVTLFHNPSFGNMPGHDIPVKKLYIRIIHYMKDNL